MFKVGDKVTVVPAIDFMWGTKIEHIPINMIGNKGIIESESDHLKIRIISGHYSGDCFWFSLNSEALKLDKVIKKIV